MEFGARAVDAAALSQVADRVDALTAGHFERVAPTKKTGASVTFRTFRTFAERWTSGELARLYPDHVDRLTRAKARKGQRS